MTKINLKNINNSELLKIRKEKIDEFERVRSEIVKIFNYWREIENDYNTINNECNKRKII